MASGDASDAEFLRRLAGRAEPDGFVPFDRWMELALYDPSEGYYARGGGPLGREGDFYTAGHVHPLFGRALAARALELAQADRSDRFLRWIELGAGDGSLTRAALPALARGWGAHRLEVVLVDRSGPLLARAVTSVSELARGLGVRVRSASSIAELGPTEGIVVANELMDAQPVRRFRRTDGGWSELGVRLRDGAVAPAERTLADRATEADLPAGAEVGSLVERSPRAEALVREVADHLVRGAFLLVDYGEEESELWAGHPRGTFAAVRQHRPVDDYLSGPGTADLSAFVNFTRLRAAAKSAGLRELAYRTQGEALVAWGIERLVAEELRAAPEARAEVALRLAVKNLLFGFSTFKVLELGAGSPAEPVAQD